VYDDVVTVDSVHSPAITDRIKLAIDMSQNLSSQDGRERYIGTRYHTDDPYAYIMKKKNIKTRVYPATDDGTATGSPVLLSQDELDQKRSMGTYVFSSQMLLDPVADDQKKFSLEQIRYHHLDDTQVSMLTRYILVDPANSKKKNSDYTAVWVVGLGEDRSHYCLDLYRDKLNLEERTALLFSLVKQWTPVWVGYEEYGMQADIQHIRYVQSRQAAHFEIKQMRSSVRKIDRICSLQPLLEGGRLFFPHQAMRKKSDGSTVDMIHEFIHEEYLPFPYGRHDDMLDALSRVCDDSLGFVWPQKRSSDVTTVRRRTYSRYQRGSLWVR
jgi:predicted phage terminase large subunit-like protein